MAQSIYVLGKQFGNVFVGVQPGFGYESDPMRLLVRVNAAPTHAFSAFYRYLREDFGAHAVCISAPMARWNSCPANRPACRKPAGPTG
jgi:cobalamin biosynthesis Mg chelatase CobN